MKLFDVAVIGGGPAGLATALRLRGLGRSVIVLEQSRYQNKRAAELLCPAAAQPLQDLGVWDAFQKESFPPYRAIRSAWGGAELTEQNMIFNPYGSGWALDRNRFDSLLASAAQQSGVEVCQSARVCQATREKEEWTLETEQESGPHRVRSRWLVWAGGRMNGLIPTHLAQAHVDDRMVGFVGWMQAPEPLPQVEPVLTLEAVRDGWWYSAPVDRQWSVAAFMTDLDIKESSGESSHRFWQTQFNRTRHMQNIFKNYNVTGKARAQNAASVYLEPATGQSWCAVGDSAFAYDPLTGQGIFKALNEALDAGEGIHEALNSHNELLKEYQKKHSKAYLSYKIEKQSYYDMEHRWPNAPFWKKRQSL